MPITEAGSRTARSRGCSWSRRAPRSAWIVAGTAISSSVPVGVQRPSSRRSRPLIDHHRDELLDEERIAVGRLSDPGAVLRRLLSPPSSSSTSRGTSAADSGRATIRCGCRLRPSSGASSCELGASRADEQHRGASPIRSRYSISSRNVGSAQCRSSKTTTSGRSRPCVSNSRRTPQKISSHRHLESPSPSAPASHRCDELGRHPQSATSFERASSGGSSSLIPAAWVTISTSGQKVMPRP